MQQRSPIPILLLVTLIAAGVAFAVGRFTGSDDVEGLISANKDQRLMSLDEGVAVFAIRQAAFWGLMDPKGFTLDYQKTISAHTGRSEVVFDVFDCSHLVETRGSGSCRKLSRHLRLFIEQRDNGLFEIADLQGPLPTGFTGKILGVADEIQLDESPHWEVPVANLFRYSSTWGLQSQPLWVGPIPFEGDSVAGCRATLKNEAGALVHGGRLGRSIVVGPLQSSEDARQGTIASMPVPRRTRVSEVTDVKVECAR
jgi:hypothetical protein